MLETVRRRLRDLIKLIDKKKRKPIYTDFEDEMGGESTMVLPGFVGDGLAKFRDKAQAFLRAHQDHITIRKLRMNKALNAYRPGASLSDAGRKRHRRPETSTARRASAGTRVCSFRYLIGMDRGAAKEALDGFLQGKSLNASQIEFANLIVNHLTEHGAMKAALLYESPFTDLTPRGP